MFEKVNPCHPDKVADRIAGAIVDFAYKLEERPRIAVEVLIGHGKALVIVETSAPIKETDIVAVVRRLTNCTNIEVLIVPQDNHLANNQQVQVRCGDNGIFKGVPTTNEQRKLTRKARQIYCKYPTDGKYIIRDDDYIICQSNADSELYKVLSTDKDAHYLQINPLGDWTGGTDVDSGATNRKLGSDMGDGVTGGGLHGKDLSKADVSVNIWCYLKAQELQKTVTAYCAIGNVYVCTSEGNVPYEDIVKVAADYIREIGGFEKFAEWGLIQ
jgi:S-adenosylmethionine synthetase